MKIVSLEELKAKAQIMEKMASQIHAMLLEPDIIIMDIPAPEKKARKKYARKTRKVDPEPETKDVPQAKVKKPRKKKSFYGDESGTSESGNV